MGAPYTKSTIFRRAECTNKKLHFLRRSRLNYRVYIPSATARAKILGYFVVWQHMTSCFQIPRGGGKCHSLPSLRATMTYSLDRLQYVCCDGFLCILPAYRLILLDAIDCIVVRAWALAEFFSRWGRGGGSLQKQIIFRLFKGTH